MQRAAPCCCRPLPGPGCCGPAPLLSMLPSTGQTMGWYAPPAASQHLAFPYSMSQRDALPMAPRGSSSLLPDRGCSGPPLPARMCLVLHCITSHLRAGNQNSRHFRSLPSPSCDPDRPCCEGTGGQGPRKHLEGGTACPASTQRGSPRTGSAWGSGGFPGAVPRVPFCVGEGGGGACWQHPSDTAGLRTPSSSAQLAHQPPAHLELLRQVQAAAHGVHGSKGKAARCHSARRQARLGATGVPLHPTRATAGHAAVPTHSLAPAPEDLIPCPRCWDGT